MIHETIELVVPGADGGAPLTAYVPDNFPALGMDRRRPALIICPGGGYEHISDREAEPVALRGLCPALPRGSPGALAGAPEAAAGGHRPCAGPL